MTQTAANVAAANPDIAGGLLWAPAGTALPTDAITALDAAYKPFGYLSADGVQPSGDPASVTDIDAWGGDIVASLKTTKRKSRFTAKLIEILNTDVLKFVFGTANVTITAASGAVPTKIAIADNGGDPADGIVVVEAFYKGKKLRRVLPNATAILKSEDPIVHSGVGSFEIEWTCLPDDDGNSQYRYLALDDAPGA